MPEAFRLVLSKEIWRYLGFILKKAMNPLLRYLLPLGALAGVFPSMAWSQSLPSVPGQILWLDASDETTIELVNGQVAVWKDKSSRGYDAFQENEDRRPIREPNALNGKPAIRFDTYGPGDPEGDGLDISTDLVLNRPYTVFIVDQYWGDVTARTLNGINANWLVGKWNGRHAHYAGNWVGVNVGVAAEIEDPTISTAVGTVHSSTWALNGWFYGGSNATDSPGNLALSITDNRPPYDEPSQADVAEVIIYNRALGRNEAERIEAYLAEKYGLTLAPRQHTSTRVDVFTGADEGEGLDFSGNFVHAIDVGGPGGYSIGDATFTDDTGFVTAENHIPQFYTPTFPADTPDGANLNTLMQSIRWTGIDNTGLEDLKVALPNLVPGRVYKLQLLFGDTASARHFNVLMDGRLIYPNFASASYTAGQPNLGVVLTHRFLAEKDTVVIALTDAGGGPDRNPLLQAVTLEDEGAFSVLAETKQVTSAADVDLQGTFVHAVNARGYDVGRAGDADFKSEENSPDVIIRADHDIDEPEWALPEFGDSPADVALAAVMRSIRWSEGNSPEKSLEVEIRGLTPGLPYKVQLFFDEASNPGRGFDISLNGVKVFRGFATGASYSPNTQEDNIAQMVALSFSAPSATIYLSLEGIVGAFSDPNPILAGLTVEALLSSPDSDADSLPDDWEMAHFGNLNQSAADDPDEDGLNNLSEYALGTHPLKADTDEDQLADGAEVALGTHPLKADTDDDGLPDGAEVNIYHTDPLRADTDGDFLLDGEEIAAQSNPLVIDTDNDGYSDKAEVDAGTKPNDPTSWPQNMTVISNFKGAEPNEGLDLDGTFVYAVDVGASGQLGQIRDAFFDSDSFIDGVTIIADQVAPTWGANANYGTSELDVSLGLLMQGIRWGNNTPVEIFIENLEVGKPYKLQLLFYEACCPNRAFGVFFDDELFVEEFSPYLTQGSPSTQKGALIVRHFVAASPSLYIVLDGGTVTNPNMTDHNPIINAITLEDLSATPPVTGTFTIKSFTKNGNSFSVEFFSTPGRSYAIDYKASLDAPQWTELADSITGATGSTTTWTATDATLGGRANGFFRVRDTALHSTP